MNVYDFDGTIYDGDSSVDFYLWCLKNKPSILLSLPGQIKGACLYYLKKMDKTEFKQSFFSFLRRVDDIDALLADFWSCNMRKIEQWYLDQRADDDVIISASPRFLLEPVCECLNIQNLIASEVDKRTGIFTGSNCRGEEKVRRYRETFGETVIENFYSDNHSDEPMTKISANSYIVRKHKIQDWQ